MDGSSKADLHVHSKYSDRPAEWFLRRIGAPECFVEPLEVYRLAKARGMDFVTISDHNCIDGALEIAHLSDAFISNEVTTYFPEDGVKIHLLVSGIDDRQFGEIQRLRQDIYELGEYLAGEQILTTVNHPLFRVNDRMTVGHVEKLLLMFKRFELVNGSRDARASILLKAILGNLTPVMIDEMADRHDLEPRGAEPWRKWTTGGSDDHSGAHVAAAYTATPQAATVDQFLAHLRSGRHEPAGSSGGSLLLANSLYHIAYGYYRDRFLRSASGKPNIIGQMFEHLLALPDDRPGVLSRFVPSFAKRFVKARQMRKLSDVERLIVEELGSLVTDQVPEPSESKGDDDRRVFETTCRVSHLMVYNVIRKVEEQLREGHGLDALQSASSLGMVAFGITPYLAAFSTQHKDVEFLETVARRFPTAGHLAKPDGGKAWITDTFNDVNGVSRTVQCLGMAALRARRPMTVITCLDEQPETPIPVVNYRPVGSFQLPEYEVQQLGLPPFLEVIETIERRRFDELVISTPGLLGLTGLAAARLLGIRKTGFYHTDLPLLVRHMTLDHGMEQLTRKYMHWFYSQMDRVFVPSEYYRQHLVDMGLDASRIFVTGHGVDLDQFNLAKADPGFWKRFGLPDGFTFVYVGRVSPDKNLDVLIESFRQLSSRRADVNLAIVGDGPQMSEFKTAADHPRISLTGFLAGEELAAAYASSQAMVFPSQTDTFGIAVLEAHASGLPAIVSDQGGPQEIVGKHSSGIVVDLSRPGEFARAMERMVDDPGQYQQFREAALRTAAESSWDSNFAALWNQLEAEPSTPTPARSRRPAESTGGLVVMDVA